MKFVGQLSDFLAETSPEEGWGMKWYVQDKVPFVGTGGFWYIWVPENRFRFHRRTSR